VYGVLTSRSASPKLGTVYHTSPCRVYGAISYPHAFSSRFCLRFNRFGWHIDVPALPPCLPRGAFAASRPVDVRPRRVSRSCAVLCGSSLVVPLLVCAVASILQGAQAFVACLGQRVAVSPLPPCLPCGASSLLGRLVFCPGGWRVPVTVLAALLSPWCVRASLSARCLSRRLARFYAVLCGSSVLVCQASLLNGFPSC